MTTWLRKRGLAVWSFTIPARPGEDASGCLRRSVPTVAAALDGFGRAASVDVATLDRGDSTYVMPDGEVDLDSLQRILERDVVKQVVAILDLVVTTEPGAEDTWFGHAGLLTFLVDDHSVDGSIAMSISIDIDIYSPLTWAEERNNAVLATLNNPRLTRFLTRVREQCDAVLERIDTDYYAYDVDQDGFH